MHHARQHRFGPGLTLLGRRLLVVYGVLYAITLLSEHWLNIPLYSMLSLRPESPEAFRIWQPFTAPFVHSPYAPLGFLIDCLVLYFFLGTVEGLLGSAGVIRLFLAATLGAEFFGAGFGHLLGFQAPYAGMMPFLLSLVVVFGLAIPDATILLLFVLPVKARYISYGTILVTVVTLMAKANPQGAYHLGGILFGWLSFRWRESLGQLEIMGLKYRRWRLSRRKAKFRVIDGEGGGKGPTIH